MAKLITVLLCMAAVSAMAVDFAANESFEGYQYEEWMAGLMTFQVHLSYEDPAMAGGIVDDAHTGTKALKKVIECRTPVSGLYQAVHKISMDDSRNFAPQNWYGATSLSFWYKGAADNDDLTAAVWIDMKDAARVKLEGNVYKTLVSDGTWHQITYSLAGISEAGLRSVHTVVFSMKSSVESGGGEMIFDDFYANAKIAVAPSPKDGKNEVSLNPVVTWLSGFDAASQKLYFSDSNDLSTVSPITVPIGSESYSPATLDPTTTYYWRVDCTDSFGFPVTGDMWSFTTLDPTLASNASPADNSYCVQPIDTDVLSWTGAAGATHNVYFGTDSEALDLVAAGLTTAQYQLEEDMSWDTRYYWRVDEVVGGVVSTGPVWTFYTVVPLCTAPVAGDLNGDCQTNFEDLAIIAGDWLTCAWWPTESCGN